MSDNTNTTATVHSATVDPAKIVTAMHLDSAFEVLIAAREKWEAGTLAASNLELYGLLSHSLDVLTRIKRSVELGRGLNKLLEARGFKVKEGTSVEVKLVRAIFVNPQHQERHKNRLFTYARVLKVAFDAGVAGAALPDFIIKHGGIDEIRRNDPTNVSRKIQDEVQLSAAEGTMKQPNFKPLHAGIPLSPQLQPDSDQYFSVALVRKDDSSTCSIVFGSNKASLVKELLALAAKEIAVKEEGERNRRKQAEVAAEFGQQIARVAEELYAVKPGFSATAAHQSLQAEPA
jgi:hypothetical protein